MKNFKTILNIAFIATTLFLTSCSSDDDGNNEPISIQDLVVTIDENPTNGQVVGTVQVDNGNGTLGFSITSQTPTGALSIDPTTGELTVADATLFDFETNPVITANISVDDDINTATGIATISLNNATELNVTDLTIDFDENPTNGQTIDIVSTTNGSGTLSFSITSQTPAGALSIDPTTGELTVADATLFDFETNPVITADISVVDAINTATAIATINLNNINELSIQDFNATIDENPTNGQSVGTVSAAGDGTLSFSITSQTPSGALSINASTGELTVADATLFDFETNPVITANISVDNSVSTETAIATIDLNNINELGDFNHGGVVFWLDGSGGGLVCAVNNQNAGLIQWNNGSNTDTGAIATAIGTGQANTTAIINSQGAGTYAAQLCDDLALNGFLDWYLPSKDELDEMFINRTIINSSSVANGGNAFSEPLSHYWTSSQHNADAAWFQFFSVGLQTPNLKSNTAHVRAVRTF